MQNMTIEWVEGTGTKKSMSMSVSLTDATGDLSQRLKCDAKITSKRTGDSTNTVPEWLTEDQAADVNRIYSKGDESKAIMYAMECATTRVIEAINSKGISKGKWNVDQSVSDNETIYTRHGTAFPQTGAMELSEWK
jgi:hypothetical protein